MKKLLRRAASLLVMAAMMIALLPAETFAQSGAEWVPIFASWNPYSIIAWALIWGTIIIIVIASSDPTPPPHVPYDGPIPAGESIDN